jgi:hypothetical protein
MLEGFALGSAVGLQASYTNGNGSATSAAVQWDGQRLYWFDEAPPVLQFNKYVRSGYRAGMNYQQCLCSIFSYHNETGVVFCCLVARIRGALTEARLAFVACVDSVTTLPLCNVVQATS